MIRILVLSIFLIFGIVQTKAQNATISGKVIDAKTNLPLSGANVKIGNKRVVITNDSGNFTFACTLDEEIQVSYISYKTIAQKIDNCTTKLIIQLQPIYDDLAEVDIIASQKELLKNPISQVHLQTKEIKRSNGLFLDDAVNINIPGVSMERRSISGGQQFNIRGYGNGIGFRGASNNFDSQGSKVYLNGIPITDAEGITVMDDIDFGSIEKVNVIKGPSGTLYGLAIAGVVQLETKKATPGETSINQEIQIGAYGLERYTTRLEIGTENSSIMLSYGKQKYDGFMPHTSSNKDFVNVVGAFQPNQNQQISGYFGVSDSYDERNGELTKEQYQDFDYSGNQAYIKNDAHSAVRSFRAGINHSYKFNKAISNSTVVFGSGISSDASSAGGWTDRDPINYGFRTVFNTKFDLNEYFNLSGVTGMEVQRQNGQTIGYRMIENTVDPDAYNVIGPQKSNTYSASKTSTYFTEWILTMPYDLSLTTGIGLSTMAIKLSDRLAENTEANPSDYSRSYNNMVSPHLAINKIFNDQLSVYASYSTGYKAPVSSYFFIPTTGQVNRNLKPEKGTQYEIGSKGAIFNKKLNYQLALFQTKFKDKMTVVAVPNNNNTATAYTYVTNGGTQDHKGLEAALSYNFYNSKAGIFSSIQPFANLTLSDFKYEDFKFQQLSSDKADVLISDYSGNTVVGVPPVVFNTGLDAKTNIGFYGNATYSYRDAMYFTSDEANRTASFNLLNAKIGFSKELFQHFSLDAYTGINNITGSQHYYMVFLNQLPDAYIPAPSEANFYGGLNMKYLF